MEVKIGVLHTAREIVLDSPQTQDEIAELVSERAETTTAQPA